MPITNKTRGVWSQDDVVKKINADRWAIYNPGADPTKLQTFGRAVIGEDGLNIPPTVNSSPVQVSGGCWCQLSMGADISGAIKCDNTLWLWGRNENGQLAQSDSINRSSPTQVPGTNWCQIATGKEDVQNTVFAIKTDNTLWGWGSNNLGELGVDSTAFACASSPVQIPGAAWCKVVAGIDNHLALRTDGTLWSWGIAFGGANGLNTTAIVSSPSQLLGTWIDMSTNINGGFAVKSDGTLWAWGINSAGQLGQSERVHRSSPTQIPGTTWCKVSSTERSVAALRTDGTLWTWGINNVGQLGIDNRAARSSPTQIPGTTWCKICMGIDRLMAEKTDKSLWMVGSDVVIENSDLAARSSPVQLQGSCWVDFGAGTCVSGIIKY